MGPRRVPGYFTPLMTTPNLPHTITVGLHFRLVDAVILTHETAVVHTGPVDWVLPQGVYRYEEEINLSF